MGCPAGGNSGNASSSTERHVPPPQEFTPFEGGRHIAFQLWYPVVFLCALLRLRGFGILPDVLFRGHGVSSGTPTGCPEEVLDHKCALRAFVFLPWQFVSIGA